MGDDTNPDRHDDFHLHYLRARCHPKAGLIAGMSHDGHLIISCKKCRTHVASYDVKNPPELKCDHPAHGKSVH